jgi:hypothetical protein
MDLCDGSARWICAITTLFTTTLRNSSKFIDSSQSDLAHSVFAYPKEKPINASLLMMEPEVRLWDFGTL